MEGIYDVTLNGKAVGQVTVTKEGLYYQFSCTVRLPEKGRYRLMACCEASNIDLGLCIPRWCTKIPIKRFKKGNYRFLLTEKKDISGIPVESHRPFSDLAMLPQARFYRENGQAFIMLNPKGSDTA